MRSGADMLYSDDYSGPTQFNFYEIMTGKFSLFSLCQRGVVYPKLILSGM